MANRVTPVAATATITSTKNMVQDDTFIIGSKTYTLRNSPSTANQVDVGTDEETTLNNLIHAINLTGTEGTTYGTDTAAVPGIIAALTSVHIIGLTSRLPGAQGNCFILTEGTDSGGAYSVSGFSGGTGDLSGDEGYLESINDLNQVNSEVHSEIAGLTEAAD